MALALDEASVIFFALLANVPILWQSGKKMAGHYATNAAPRDGLVTLFLLLARLPLAAKFPACLERHTHGPLTPTLAWSNCELRTSRDT